MVLLKFQLNCYILIITGRQSAPLSVVKLLGAHNGEVLITMLAAFIFYFFYFLYFGFDF